MIPSQSVTEGEKPLAEVIVEGELSPFEHEALYRILRKSFRLEHPSYTELADETIGTRVNLVFYHPYAPGVFTNVLQENWRDLKELFKQVRYRRGRIGAAFTFTFVDPEIRLIFNSGVLEERQLSSALDQMGHLTGIIRQMLRPETMEQPLRKVEASFDARSDRWHNFHGSSSNEDRYVFDESLFRWVRS